MNTNLTKEQMNKIQEKVKENFAALSSCKGHVFMPVIMDGDLTIKSFVCKHCKGEINSMCHYWFITGQNQRSTNPKKRGRK